MGLFCLQSIIFIWSLSQSGNNFRILPLLFFEIQSFFVDQTSLKLEILLTLPPKGKDYRHVLPCCLGSLTLKSRGSLFFCKLLKLCGFFFFQEDFSAIDPFGFFRVYSIGDHTENRLIDFHHLVVFEENHFIYLAWRFLLTESSLFPSDPYTRSDHICVY